MNFPILLKWNNACDFFLKIFVGHNSWQKELNTNFWFRRSAYWALGVGCATGNGVCIWCEIIEVSFIGFACEKNVESCWVTEYERAVRAYWAPYYDCRHGIFEVSRVCRVVVFGGFEAKYDKTFLKNAKIPQIVFTYSGNYDILYNIFGHFKISK